MEPAVTERTMHLLNGRRVQLSDLIEAKLLDPGAKLAFSRTRIGATYHAMVLPTGRIQLEDGQEFRSPSTAATEASGARAIAGWHAWVVESSGETLDLLRRKLLDRVAARSTDAVMAQDSSDDVARLHERLRSARDRADAQDPEEIRVSELLALWGARDRSDHVSRIEADLANYGLITSPSFRKVTLETPVRLVSAASAESTDEQPVSGSEDDEEEGFDRGLTLGNLPSALGGVESVAPNATMEEVITKMMLHDYSQLAVLAGKHALRGAVTWKSIAQVRHTNPAATLSEVIVRATAKRYDEELVDVLPDLEATGFVFVSNENNAVSGIVTTADVVHAYGQLATPFFLIGELDRLLRGIISEKFDIEEVITICDIKNTGRITAFDNLSMGDYKRVVETPWAWAKLGWPLDRATLIGGLERVRQVRNNVMHFNPDPLPQGAVDMLRNTLRLLREYRTNGA